MVPINWWGGRFGIKLRPRVVFHPIFRPVSSEIGTSGRANFNMGDLTSYDSRHLIVQLWIAEIAIHNCNILLPPRARSIIASIIANAIRGDLTSYDSKKLIVQLWMAPPHQPEQRDISQQQN